jgi:hypothetical protein
MGLPGAQAVAPTMSDIKPGFACAIVAARRERQVGLAKCDPYAARAKKPELGRGYPNRLLIRL